MNAEIAVVAFIGSVVSVLMGYPKVDCMRGMRSFFSGFFFAYFLGADIVNVIQHYLSFKVSHGGIIFLSAVTGTALLERILILIGVLNMKPWKTEK